MKIGKLVETVLLSGVSLLFFFPNVAWAEKIKLLCNLDTEVIYSSGDPSLAKERIQIDIESLGDKLFIFANGTAISFSMSSVRSKTRGEVINSSDTNVFELDAKKPSTADEKMENSEYIKIDRNSGVLYYRYLGKLQKTATGSCVKINQNRKLF